mmetsp:Transcript_15468/g.31791  ORF Transcript_15468/g.31791 Transcript_15468/m.31791 type:complete len:218 (+) Transcript_15468:198-851(+)
MWLSLLILAKPRTSVAPAFANYAPTRANSVAHAHRKSPCRRLSSHSEGGEANDDASAAVVLFRGTSVEVRSGQTLRTALLLGGVSPHNGRAKLVNCRGLGTCGTCAVEVLCGEVHPPTASRRERARLLFPPHSRSPANAERLRLACQCTVAVGGGAVELAKYDGFWGQELEALSTEPAGAFKTYLGDLEYPFDSWNQVPLVDENTIEVPNSSSKPLP